jgi:cytochrome bd-type quinol oxidase subunit 2
MVGFASVSTTWNPFDPNAATVDALKQMTIILLISRAMLAIQYAIVMIYAWRYEKTKVPLAIHTMVMFLSAIIYLGVRHFYIIILTQLKLLCSYSSVSSPIQTIAPTSVGTSPSYSKP